MKNQKAWRKTRKILSRLLNISGDIIDFLSCYDILLLSVSGNSLQDISNFLDIDIEVIKDVIARYLGKQFCNVVQHMDYNPYFLFRWYLLKTLSFPSYDEINAELEQYGHNNLPKLYYNAIIKFNTLRYYYLSKYRKEDYGNFVRRNSEEIARI